MPLVLWGHADGGRDLFDDFTLTESVRKRLLEDVGLSYLQTDAICINKLHADKIYYYLSKV
ncbi:MAG: hypothetical protein MN733_17285 [Nitrososphaera sp.]|nr:hypothetical protein [Nitrososphaera sp.]